MAARAERSNQYIPHFALDTRYAPVMRRGSTQVELCMRSSFPTRRLRGDTNIDLWINGDIYPVDPMTGKPPPIKSLKEFVEFICHGEQGLRGYTQRLLDHCVHGSTQEETRIQLAQLSEEVLQLRGEALASNSRAAQDVQLGRMRCLELEKKCRDLQAELQAVRDCHAQRVEQLERHVRGLQEDVDRCQRRASFEKETPMGMRNRRRALRGIHELKPGSGGSKARVKLVRTVLQPDVVQFVVERNRENRKCSRLRGDKESQNRTAVALARILSRHEGVALASQPAMAHVQSDIAKNVLKSIGKSIGPDKILAACDQAGVSHRGYGALYKSVKAPIAGLNKGVSGSILPSPYHVKLLRQELNANLPQYIGEYYHAEGRLTLPASSKKNKKSEDMVKEVVLTEKNSLFTDPEVVQRSMVIFYGITKEGNVITSDCCFQSLLPAGLFIN